jgi:hypothetical protein
MARKANRYWEDVLRDLTDDGYAMMIAASPTAQAALLAAVGAPVALGTGSARLCHTGGEPAIATTSGTDATPVVTEIYLAEVFIPANATVTGIAIFNGSAVTDDVKVGLYSTAGVLLATNATGGAGTTQAGTDAYQRIPFTAAYSAKGPAAYYVGIIFDGTTSRFNTHTVGNFGAGKLTGHVYATAMETTAITGLTMPTTFTTALGPIASLY